MEKFTSTQLANNAGGVIHAALTEPVMITRHNRDTVVVLSVATYNALLAAAGRRPIPQRGTDHD